MPELPEVETVRRQLAETLTGARVVRVTRVEPYMLRDCSEEQLRAELPGRRLEEVDRWGKFLIVRLEGEAYLTLHLGMTGQLLLEPRSWDAYTRFGFELLDDAGKPLTLHFRDVRKFGRLHLTLGKPAPRLALLGPDAWMGDWDASYLARRLGRRRAPLKAVLLDQSVLAGIGNIYADETLWWTELSPLRPAAALTEEEVGRLAGEIRRRLGEGVKLLGCSLSDFVDIQGKAGGFQEWLQAYGRKGRPCGRCGEVLVRVVVAGRGTTFCPACQH
jgi:formamidopyrimidine-DNA glycosylase